MISPFFKHSYNLSGALLMGAAHFCLATGCMAQPATQISISPSVPILRGPAVTVGVQPLELLPENAAWDLSRTDSIYFQVRNPNDKPITIWASARNEGAKIAMDSVRSAINIGPGATATLRLRLMRRPVEPDYAPFDKFFMYYKQVNVRDNTVDPSAIAAVAVWMEAPQAGQKFVVESAIARGEGSPVAPNFLPFVDQYGQYNHTDWPDKIYSDADFATALAKEKAEMSNYPGPADWDKWGGWARGPQQKATGYFYPAKVDGKWWLVDPDGALFWSYGPTGVGFGGGKNAPVTDKESWFVSLPPRAGATEKYWAEGKDARYRYYQGGKEWRSYDFVSSNAERKFGPDWRMKTAEFQHKRLRNWGFNTIANWSDAEIYGLKQTPYTVAIHYGGPNVGNMPDVFDAGFETTLRARMEKERDTTANDPWNIGYFVDNELKWTFLNGAEGAVRSALIAGPESGTKNVLIADLKAKYQTIDALNQGWRTNYASWQAMQDGRVLLESKDEKARSVDLSAFGLKMADKYFSTARKVVKDVAPNNLYLGCRFHGHIDTEIVKIAAKYADVVSYNVYEKPDARLNRYIGVVDKPFIVGEFGVESAPGQTPFRSDVKSPDPQARVDALEDWVIRAIKHPLIVGGHFFQFRDQPLTGRGDGEAILRGFVNGADTPHFDLVQANRRFGYQLYEHRSEAK